MSDFQHTVRILKKDQLTHDVFRFILERPSGFHFTAGQAIEVTVDHPALINKPAPFTLTGLSEEDFLEIILKIYPDHEGVTLNLSTLNPGNTLFISEAWDSFEYHSPGIFIAGGTGATPFIAILRMLRQVNGLPGNKLIFANKTIKDIFLQDEFEEMLGYDYINILSHERHPGYAYGFINWEFLNSQINDFSQAFYLCGPASFSKDISNHLISLGANKEMIFSEY